MIKWGTFGRQIWGTFLKVLGNSINFISQSNQQFTINFHTIPISFKKEIGFES
jgi:hypothetical protein